MKITGRELIDVLETKATLEWYRYPRYHPGASTSAAVVWRYDPNQNGEQINRINAAIESNLEGGGIKWGFRFKGRNWGLVPSLLLELESSGKFKGEKAIYNYLAQESPDFFDKACIDLARIANAVANYAP